MAFKQPKFWKTLLRHPLSAEYEDLAPSVFLALVEDIQTNGFDKNRFIVMAPDEADGGKMKVLDGWQRLQASIKGNVKPVFGALPRGMSPEEYVHRHNDNRRHESDAARKRRLDARASRVAEAAVKGESNRTIAEKEGVSEVTVRKDKDKAEAAGLKTVPDSGKVKDKHGVERPAKVEKEEPKPKSGKPRFDNKAMKDSLGSLIRLVDKKANAMGKGSLPMGNLLNEDLGRMRAIHNKIALAKNYHDRCVELHGWLMEEIKHWE